jgi:hypothetical protein
MLIAAVAVALVAVLLAWHARRKAGEVLGTILFFSRDEREPDPGLARLLQAGSRTSTRS